MAMNRRDFFNLAGAGLVGGATLASSPLLADHKSKHKPDKPPGQNKTDNTDEGERVTFQNEQNLVVENLTIFGSLRLFDCPNAIVRNVEVWGGNVFGGLICRDSPGTKIYDARLHNNRGHGLFLRGEIDGIEAHRVESWENQEDGVQLNNDAFGIAKLFDPVMWGNLENAVDVKSGRLEIHGGRLEDTGGGRGDEILLTHNFAQSLLLDGTHLFSHSAKAFLRLASGSAELRNVGFFKESERKWYVIIDEDGSPIVYDKALDLDVPRLKVINGSDI